MSKHDDGKYKPTLIYTSLIKAIAKVREHGAEKYGSTEDWRENEPSRHFDAIYRHLNAHIDGEYWDESSKLPHLHLAATTLMFEIERVATATEESKGAPEVEIQCSRCKSKDLYRLGSVHSCTNNCGNIIDTTL